MHVPRRPQRCLSSTVEGFSYRVDESRATAITINYRLPPALHLDAAAPIQKPRCKRTSFFSTRDEHASFRQTIWQEAWVSPNLSSLRHQDHDLGHYTVLWLEVVPQIDEENPMSLWGKEGSPSTKLADSMHDTKGTVCWRAGICLQFIASTDILKKFRNQKYGWYHPQCSEMHYFRRNVQVLCSPWTHWPCQLRLSITRRRSAQWYGILCINDCLDCSVALGSRKFCGTQLYHCSQSGHRVPYINTCRPTLSCYLCWSMLTYVTLSPPLIPWLIYLNRLFLCYIYAIRFLKTFISP